MRQSRPKSFLRILQVRLTTHYKSPGSHTCAATEVTPLFDSPHSCTCRARVTSRAVPDHPPLRMNVATRKDNLAIHSPNGECRLQRPGLLQSQLRIQMNDHDKRRLNSNQASPIGSTASFAPSFGCRPAHGEGLHLSEVHPEDVRVRRFGVGISQPIDTPCVSTVQGSKTHHTVHSSCAHFTEVN